MVGFLNWMLKNESLVTPTLIVLFIISVVIALIAWINAIVKARRFLKANKGKKIKDTTW